MPIHIVQRGVDRQDCFRFRSDYRTYLEALREMAGRYAVDIHAYVLMTNHVHLLTTPHTEDGASRMMQQLGRQYVRHFNWRHDRTGTLWEGRFKSSIIRSDRYLLACYRYIELNPVRAGLVSDPAEYEWSSYKSNASGQPGGLLRPHRLWLLLGSDIATRRAAYQRLFSVGEPQSADELIRKSWRRNAPLA